MSDQDKKSLKDAIIQQFKHLPGVYSMKKIDEIRLVIKLMINAFKGPKDSHYAFSEYKFVLQKALQ